jgi:hypothetical protein
MRFNQYNSGDQCRFDGRCWDGLVLMEHGRWRLIVVWIEWLSFIFWNQWFGSFWHGMYGWGWCACVSVCWCDVTTAMIVTTWYLFLRYRLNLVQDERFTLSRMYVWFSAMMIMYDDVVVYGSIFWLVVIKFNCVVMISWGGSWGHILITGFSRWFWFNGLTSFVLHISKVSLVGFHFPLHPRLSFVIKTSPYY